MKRLFKLFLLILFIASVIAGCNKSTAVNLPSNRFTWTYKGTGYTAYIDTAYLYSRGTNVIFAAQGNTLGSFPRCDFQLSSFSSGSYPFGSLGINIFRYVDNNGNISEATSGSINITSNSNNVMSGNFSATLENSSGSTTPIAGSFTNMSVVP